MFVPVWMDIGTLTVFLMLLKLLFERGQKDTKTAAPGESGVPPKEKGRRGMEPYTNINVKKIKL